MLSKSAVKDIQSLQHKKFRDEAGLFVAEGPTLVKEMLDAGIFSCREIYHTDDWPAMKLTGNINVCSIVNSDLARISSRKTPNQVLAIFEKKTTHTPIAAKDIFTLVLDGIQDPGNLGTIIRIADWFGIQNIICSPDTADCYNSKVVQSTMASLGRVNIIYTNLLEWLQIAGDVPVYAATLHGKALQEIKKTVGGILIIGNEAHGVSHEMLTNTTMQVTIPKIGEAESLNAAVATAIILHSFMFNGIV